ncbi:MAG: serine/threonine-protein kinase [Myxococcota bacterium]
MTPTTACPNDEAFVGLARGSMEPEARLELLAHAADCPVCHDLLADVLLSAASEAHADTLAATGEATPQRRRGAHDRGSAGLEPGARIGRYEVLERIGQGGMGVVLAAHDPELDRKVALKLLIGRVHSDDQRARLLREAKALAQLQHPHVVTVNDVGVHEGQIFLAMEFVAGQTLRGWLAERDRRWQDVVPVFADAARGLLAVHSAGLVHRDFKPDNVMLDRTGRVLLMDFGLVGTEDTFEALDTPTGSSGELEDIRRTQLTRSGSVMGTPRYMSPEQFRASHTGPATDQFSFCVALYEALFRRRAFEGETVADLSAAVTSGRRRPRPESTEVPRRIADLVERGLSLDPDDRWPSMASLIDELVVTPRRRSWLPAAGLATLAAVGVAWAATGADAVDRCEHTAAPLQGVWDAGRRASVEAALARTDLEHAGPTWERVRTRLDDYAEQWAAARRDACEATHLRGEQSPETMDLRTSCLDRRLRRLAALVEVLEEADATTVHRAVGAASGLGSIERCNDVEALAAEESPPEDPQIAAKVLALEATLDRVYELTRAGRYGDARAALAESVEPAQALGYEPTIVRTLALSGMLAEAFGEYADAQTALEEAYRRAVAAGLTGDAATAAAELANVMLVAADYEKARWWAAHAQSQAQAQGYVALKATIVTVLARAADDEGKYEEAWELHQQALEIWSGMARPEPLHLAVAYHNLGNVAGTLGRFDEAIDLLLRAKEIRERELGPAHPDVANTESSLGATYESALRVEEAEPSHRRAIEIWEKAFGPDHVDLAIPLHNLANLSREAERYEESEALFKRAIAIEEASYGRDHPMVAISVAGLATTLSAKGDLEAARVMLARVVRSLESRLGPDHPNLIEPCHNLGVTFLDLGDAVQAERWISRSLTIAETLGEDTATDLRPMVKYLAVAKEQLGKTKESETLRRRLAGM